MNAIQPLAKETVRFLNSGQVITDLSTIVKELVEYVFLLFECGIYSLHYCSVLTNSNRIDLAFNKSYSPAIRNALDAGATSIEVKLVDYGLSAISVSSI